MIWKLSKQNYNNSRILFDSYVVAIKLLKYMTRNLFIIIIIKVVGLKNSNFIFFLKNIKDLIKFIKI